MSRQFPSNIVSDNIDAEFPVAGQDNDSQGFRDNFQTIKDSLATANGEISDLQENAARLDDDNDFGGRLLTNATVKNLFQYSYPDTSISTSTTNLSILNGEHQVFSFDNDCTVTFTNWPESGLYAKVRVTINSKGVNRQIVFATEAGGSVKPLTGSQTTVNTGTDVNVVTILDAWTSDGGENVYFSVLGGFESSTGIVSINDIGDVTITGTPGDNQVLKYSTSTNQWVNAAHVLDGLSDVVITGTPTNGQVLKYNGTNWVNVTNPVSGLSDVVITGTPTNGQVLKYNGTNWVNGTDEVGDNLSLTALTDVELGVTPIENQVLKYNGTNWVNGSSGIDDLSDVVITGTPANGQVLKYNGTNWVNGTDEVGDNLSLNSLNDVVITTGTLVDNQVVKYDSTSQTWINIVLDYSEIANTPDIPADISDLTDTTSLIPTDTNELTNGANFITASAIPAADINNWLGSEDLADAGAVNLSKSAAYFTTSTAETATLAAASTEGKIIVLAAADVSLGSMVVTVTDPSWTGAGTITFAAQGAACTLQYINSKWYCIGNNGATFA